MLKIVTHFILCISLKMTSAEDTIFVAASFFASTDDNGGFLTRYSNKHLLTTQPSNYTYYNTSIKKKLTKYIIIWCKKVRHIFSRNVKLATILIAHMTVVWRDGDKIGIGTAR